LGVIFYIAMIVMQNQILPFDLLKALEKRLTEALLSISTNYNHYNKLRKAVCLWVVCLN